MERLGLGPDTVFSRNPQIVYGRMTGWGQDGPIAHTAGHDINYIALTGALYAIGSKSSGPVPPLNLIGDFGGGALYMALGALAAYIEAQRSGRGQVVDTSMVEGAASLMTAAFGARAAGSFLEERETNRLDGGCHHYNTYETSDGEHICIGSNEPQFYQLMLKTVGLDAETLPDQSDREHWPMMRDKLQAIFKTKTRTEWTEVMQDIDVCFAPVLRMGEALKHPQNVHRGSFVELDGVPQPGPAPRFARTPSDPGMPPAFTGQNTVTSLSSWGFSKQAIEELIESGAVLQA